MLSIVIGAAIALALAAPTYANLGKPVLFQDGIDAHVGSSFWTYLAPTQSTWGQWAWGWLPQTCFNGANSNGVSPYDIEVFNVQYTDCGKAWVFCRHHNAVLSQIDMIDLFGRIPVHERQWVRHVMAFPSTGNGVAAYMSNADITLLGSSGTPMIFQHEITHALDFYKNGVRSSSTSQWTTAINEDSCVPEAYSNTNEIEDYATVGLMSLYEIITPGGLDVIGNWRCLLNQKIALDTFQRGDMYPGGSCARRWADDINVKMGPAAGRANAKIVGPIPSPASSAGVPLGGIPGPSMVGPHTFKNVVYNETERQAAIVRQTRWMKELKGVDIGGSAE